MAAGPAPKLIALARRPNLDFSVEPGLRGEAQGAVRIFPIRWAPPLVGFACSPATIRSARALRR